MKCLGLFLYFLPLQNPLPIQIQVDQTKTAWSQNNLSCSQSTTKFTVPTNNQQQQKRKKEKMRRNKKNNNFKQNAKSDKRDKTFGKSKFLFSNILDISLHQCFLSLSLHRPDSLILPKSIFRIVNKRLSALEFQIGCHVTLRRVLGKYFYRFVRQTVTQPIYTAN